MPIISLDFETYNTLNLKQTGADLYASSPDLIVTVAAWALDAGPVKSMVVPQSLPEEVRLHLAMGSTLHAWNAAFEWAILKHHYGIELPWYQVECTQQRALYAGLPASLAGAGRALGLPESLLKDVSGHRLMLAMAKPRLQGGLWHEDDLGKLRALKLYCEQDVVTERALAKRLPHLPPGERAVSLLDHQANQRGLALDLDLVGRLKRVSTAAVHRLNAGCDMVTGGRVSSPGTQTAKLGKWVMENAGIPMSFDKESVAQALEDGTLPDEVRDVLEIRQEVAKSSVRKLKAMTDCVGADGRVRGQLQYYGASRTGRFAGRLIQVQNMPRLTLDKPLMAAAIGNIKAGAGAEFIGDVYGPPLDIVAQSLRSCLVPGPDKKFVTYDFKQIEARVLAWVAGQNDALEAFRQGADIYVHVQKKMGLSSRLAGKVVVLACGYGMGALRFVETAKLYGLDLSEGEARVLVDGWRAANGEIVDFWYHIEYMLRRALAQPDGFPQIVNPHLSFQGHRGGRGVTIVMVLPSWRKLFYRNVRTEEDNLGRKQLVYDGVDQKTKRWGPLRTWGGKLTENAVQAIARDVLTEAALKIDQAGLGKLVLSVHDELVLEVDERVAAAASDLIKVMVEESPVWAADLPVGADGGVRSSYGV